MILLGSMCHQGRGKIGAKILVYHTVLGFPWRFDSAESPSAVCSSETDRITLGSSLLVIPMLVVWAPDFHGTPKNSRRGTL